MPPLLHKTIQILKKAEEPFCLLLTASLFCFFSFFILFHADWVIGDDYETLQTTAIGRPESITRHIGQENIANGRFYPLGHYDLNIITLMPYHGPAAHYIYIWLQFLTISLLLWKLSGGLSNSAKNSKPSVLCRTIFLCIFLTGFGFTWIYFELSYPERFLMILLSAFVLLSHKAIASQKAIFYILSLLAAAYSSYMKEPVFIIFCVFSAVNLLFNKNRTYRDNVFYYALIANGAVFLALYYFLAFRGHTDLYSTANGNTFFTALLLIFIQTRLNIIFLIVLIYRLYQMFIKRNRENIFENSILFAGFFYMMAFAVLKMSNPYYFLPAELLALPAIVSTVSNIKTKWIKYSSMACSAAILVTNMLIWSVGPKLYYIARTTNMPLIRSISEHRRSGGKLWWYLPDYDVYTLPANANIMGKRDIYSVFIDYASMKAENRISKDNVPGKDNFTYVHNADKFNPGTEDVFFLPLYYDANGNNLPLPEGMIKKLYKNDFVPLMANLHLMRIFVKKGSYIENSYLLNIRPDNNSY